MMRMILTTNLKLSPLAPTPLRPLHPSLPLLSRFLKHIRKFLFNS